MATFDDKANFGYGLVLTPPTPPDSGTTLVLESGNGANFPAVTNGYNCVVWPANARPTKANAEIIRVTIKSTDTFTITRAQEGSTARTILAGDQFAFVPSAKVFTDIEALIRDFATPAIVLGSAAAAGSAATVIRSDATIAAFDATNPSTQAFSDTPVVGVAAYAARRDHKHGMPAEPGVPAKIIAHLNDTVANMPSGWSELTAARGYTIVGMPASGTLAGTVGSALTNLLDKTHTHTGPSHQHGSPITQVANYGLSTAFGTAGASVTNTRLLNASSAGSGSDPTLQTDAQGTGATGTAATSNVMPYIQYPAVVKS